VPWFQNNLAAKIRHKITPNYREKVRSICMRSDMRADHIKNFCRLEGVDYMTSEYACQEFELRTQSRKTNTRDWHVLSIRRRVLRRRVLPARHEPSRYCSNGMGPRPATNDNAASRDCSDTRSYSARSVKTRLSVSTHGLTSWSVEILK